jgi:signal transduction histidine kinase
MAELKTVGQAERIFRRVGTVIYVGPDESVAAAARRMTDNDVGCLVVQEGDKLVGILSERDVVARVVSLDQSPAETKVREVMTTNVVTADFETQMDEVQTVMTTHGIRHLPVVTDGTVVGMVSSRDVLACQLYEVTARLARASKAAKVARQAKRQLLDNVSHELRTPMNGILGVTELAMDTQMTDEQRGLLGMIKDSAHSLMGVVENILDFSQIDAGQTSLDHRPFSLSETVAGAVGPHRRASDRKGLKFVCQIATEVPDALVGDPARLRQVVSNLISNAVKFTDRGLVMARVDLVHKTEADATIHFSVDDTGPGIAPDKQRSVFEPFQQADGSHTRQHGGTGLGLSICSELVRMMGGKLTVKSAEGEGSRFEFALTLPVAGSTEALAFRNPATWREYQPAAVQSPFGE